MSAHVPVMLPEVLEALSSKAGEVYVDGTFGAGGYTRGILEAADCKVIAIDRDPNVVQTAESVDADHGDRFEFLAGCFGDLKDLLGPRQVDGVVLDLGVSSMQLDQAERGFSFRFDGPLDMRMGGEGQSAADLVNETPEKELADIIYLYGEERKSRQIAAAIVRRRAEEKFTSTADLADLVRSIVKKSPKDKSDPATRTFQALRIAVNDELGEVERVIEAANDVLAPGGRLVIVTFHSLEDRLVKNGFKALCGKDKTVSRYMPAQEEKVSAFEVASNKAVLPSDDEIAQNPRSRSAKLRVIRKKGGVE